MSKTLTKGKKGDPTVGEIVHLNGATKQSLVSNIPLSGRLAKALINNFTRKPKNNDDTWEDCSIGVAYNSIVATDSQSMILVGERADLHVATQRKEALLEAERASLYGEAVRLEDIDRNMHKETGEALPMPYVQALIGKSFNRMLPIASVNPEALLAIGKVAIAAGALGVELYQPEADPSVLGFRFKFEPESDHINLFSTWEGPIEAQGVFRVGSASRVKAQDVEEDGGAPEVQGPSQRARKKKEDAQQPAAASGGTIDVPIPEPLPPLDLIARADRGAFKLPPLAVLDQVAIEEVDTGDYDKKIIDTLKSFGLPGRIIATHAGPTVTQYELDVPGGTSVKRIASMADDLQMQLAVKSVRIQAPIPGKKAIGIEIPNKKARIVSLFEITNSHEFVNSESRLLMAIGQDISGRPVYGDLATMPHLLMAGATNAGKSIGIACLLSSLLLRNTPKDMRLVLIDPKQVELSLFEGLPHLMCPVVTNVQEVAGVLRALVREMEHRYELLKDKGVRDIKRWNEKALEFEQLPYIVVVIDELADLMMQARDEVEPLIVRLAQKARAIGIHLIVATQRPSVDVVTGLIKANMPSRIAFSVASQVDSRVILDSNGAEKLLGRGDQLFSPIDAGGKTTRVQGAYVSEEEVAAICRMWTEQGATNYDLPLEADDKPEKGERSDDDLYDQAVAFAREKGQMSTSMLQRQYSIGFQRASAMLERMEEEKIVGPRDGPRPRKVLSDGNSEATEG